MRVQLTGTFTLPADVEVVMPLFTAEGERSWAPGWDPVWADEEHRHEVGEVWTTQGPPVTHWVTVDASPTSVRYARVAPGDSAGLVAVACAASSDGTTVTVSYDLTALSPEGAARLEQFQAGYDEMLAHWQHFTTHALH
ncbi:MAG: hypothetical protein QOE99_1093 [Actinomycetota bacterium]|nr:hypothetical protein [Actinomycetota bacterium]